MLLLFFLLLTGCYNWISNSEFTGTILSEKYYKYENIVEIKMDEGFGGEKVHVRFQLAVEGKGGYDEDFEIPKVEQGMVCLIKNH